MANELLAIGVGVLYVIFMGFVVAPNVGLFFTWIHRKLGARMQWRVGPPIYQPWADFVKLMSKETLVPATAHRTVFLLAPPIALFSAVLAFLIMPFVIRSPLEFTGDVIVVLYLMIMPAIAAMIGGSASGNPYAAVGVQREMTLVFSYEFPFITAVLVPVLKAGSLRFADIVSYQMERGPFLLSVSGAIAFAVSIMVMQAKLAFPPFDIPEAKTEIIAGPYTEYSGASLALFKLAHATMLFVLPCFVANIFLGGLAIRFNDPVAATIDVVLIIVKLLALVMVMALIRFFYPRARPDQAFGMFWKAATTWAAIALTLSVISVMVGLPYL
jgi:NADH-quinone oxidoreductase subunit H